MLSPLSERRLSVIYAPARSSPLRGRGISSNLELCQKKHAHCIFEYIYFARLDSTLDGVSVYEARLRGGASTKAYPADADLVTGVPDSGLAAAQGAMEASGMPFRVSLLQKQLCGTYFIKPTQKERENSVRLQAQRPGHAVKGKNVAFLSDDSIARRHHSLPGSTVSLKTSRRSQSSCPHQLSSLPVSLAISGTDVPSNQQLLASSLCGRYLPHHRC